MPLYVQGGIHGNEFEGVDANMRTIERLATTPYGADPEVDAILDGAVVIFNVIQNPDGRVVGRGERQRLRPQPRLPDAVAVGDEGVGPDHAGVAAAGDDRPARLQLHADADRGDDEAAQPGIDYDLWLKWNQSRIDANEAALNAVNLNVTRPINDWCSDGRISVQGGTCPDGNPAARRSPRAGTTGPVLHADVLAARRPERLTVEMCFSTSTSTNPLNRCYLNADPDPAKNPIGRNAALLAARDDLVDARLRHGERNELLNDQLEIYRRGVAGEARPRAARRRSTSRTTGCTSSRPRT